MNKEEYLLELNHVSKAFPGVQALNDVSFRLKAGTVHALMGENGAGKSTFMKCLFGVYRMDTGEVKVNGKVVNFDDPRQALDYGVSMVHQELNQVAAQSVMENIWLGRFPRKGIVVDKKKMYQDTKNILTSLELSIDPSKRIDQLSVSERQMIEIAKAVSSNAKIIVLDEPTSSLTEKEVAHLFRIIKGLKEKGCGIIYISHKMDEILEISDEVTVMRDGEWVATTPACDITIEEIIKQMVGRSFKNLFPEKDNVPSEKVILQVRNLKGYYQPTVTDASFDLHEGEILGVAGLMGSRRTEMVETIFGIRRRGSGQIILNGEEIEINSPKAAIKNGLSLITEERRQNGIFEKLSVGFNIEIANIKKYCNSLSVYNQKKSLEDTYRMIDTLRVKTPSQKTKIESLSGGNQQKAIIGRWLLTESQILMMDEPTRGIDVGTKYEIYQLMINLAKQKKSVIFISSEMIELLGVTDRILIFSNGRIAGIVDTKETSQEEIMKFAARYL